MRAYTFGYSCSNSPKIRYRIDCIPGLEDWLTFFFLWEVHFYNYNGFLFVCFFKRQVVILSVFDELPVSGRLMRGFHGSGLHVTHMRKAPFPAWCEKLWSGACFRFLVSACQGPCQICHEEHRTGTWRRYLLARSISSYCASLLCVWPQDLLLPHPTLRIDSLLYSLFFRSCSCPSGRALWWRIWKCAIWAISQQPGQIQVCRCWWVLLCYSVSPLRTALDSGLKVQQNPNPQGVFRRYRGSCC